MKPCTVYIDESGDLGIGKGTQWFVISAVIVLPEDEKQLRQTIASIKDRLNLKTIHFRSIRDFTKKLYVVSQVKLHEFTIVNVIADTTKLPLKNVEKAYNFMSRILLERVSWYLRDNELTGTIVFSSRNTKRDKELTSYLQDKVLNYQ